MATATGTSPWWTPGTTGNDDYGNTQWGLSLKEQNLPTTWYRYGRTQGVPDDESAFSRWFANQYGNFVKGYGSWTMSNPFGNVDEYTNTLGGYDDWYRQWAKQAPQLRGLEPGSRGGGPVRWIGWQ